MQWSPGSIHLAIATSSPRIFIWSLGGASVCDIPLEGSKEFIFHSIKWNPNGISIMIIYNKSQLMIAYP